MGTTMCDYTRLLAGKPFRRINQLGLQGDLLTYMLAETDLDRLPDSNCHQTPPIYTCPHYTDQGSESTVSGVI
jgi:hypothetical protein